MKSPFQSRPIRVRLDDKEFAALVRGHVISLFDVSRYVTVEVMLADIGFARMLELIREAQNPQSRSE